MSCGLTQICPLKLGSFALFAFYLCWQLIFSPQENNFFVEHECIFLSHNSPQVIFLSLKNLCSARPNFNYYGQKLKTNLFVG